MKYIGSISAPVDPVESWPIVECDGVAWYVAPVYVAPVARRDVAGLCTEWGCEVPTPALVDAIWQAADLRLDPYRLLRRPMTWANASTMTAFIDQAARIEREIAGRLFALLTGTHKDHATVNGRTDLYGLHDANGKPIQPFGTSHDGNYLDCHGGLRLCCRVPTSVGCTLEVA